MGATLLCGLLLLAPVAAQQPADETLLGGGLDSGGYGGPRVVYTRLRGTDAVFVGGEGGWLLDHHFILGGAGFGLVTEHAAPAPFADELLRMGYGGVMLGYTVAPHKLVHGTLTVMVGAGGVGTRVRGGGDTDHLSDAFFVLEPTLTLELNLASFVRFGLGGSYRWLRGVTAPGLSNADLSGVAGSAILKFGSF